MKKIFVILALLALTSCGITKHVTKNKSVKHTDSTATAETRTTTTEKADTNIALPGDTTEFQVDPEDTTEQVIETPTNKIIFHAKKPGQRKRDITTINKPRVIPVKIDRTTTTASKSTVNVKTDARDTSKTTDKQTNVFNPPWWFWLLLWLAVLAAVLWWSRRK